MLKRIFILSSVLFLSFSAKVYPQNTAVGIKGGGNASYLIGEEAPVLPEKLLSYNAGVFLNFRLSDITSFRTELSYARKKYEFSSTIRHLDDGRLHVKETNDYLVVPVLLTFRQGDDVLSAFVNFGPEIAIHINNERELNATSSGFPISGEPYYNFDLNTYDYGISAGGGLQFRPFILDMRYFLSLRPLYTGTQSLEMRYMNLYLNIGYTFNYVPPRSFDRTTTWQSFKYKLKRLFR